MKSWMTRLARARWCRPPSSAGSGRGTSASKPWRASNSASAMPPSPPPADHNQSRRESCLMPHFVQPRGDCVKYVRAEPLRYRGFSAESSASRQQCPSLSASEGLKSCGAGVSPATCSRDGRTNNCPTTSYHVEEHVHAGLLQCGQLSLASLGRQGIAAQVQAQKRRETLGTGVVLLRRGHQRLQVGDLVVLQH